MKARCFLLKMLIAASAAITQLAMAQAWPARPVTFVVPVAPGGSTDMLGRVLAEKLTTMLGQPVIVDNRAGAGGLIGGSYVAKAAPDGYTILLPPMSVLAINPTLYDNMPFNVQQDLAPVIQLVSLYNLLVVNPDLPIKSVDDLIKYAKENPDKLSFASAGAGTSQHITGELFKAKANVKMVHVPYKGGAPAMVDLLAGRVSMMFGNLPEMLPYIKSGKLRPIAFGTATSSPLLPEVPTIGKTIPGFEIQNWFGVVAPGKTPPAIVQNINDAFQKALEQPDVRAKLTEMGFEIRYSRSPAIFARTIEDDTARWATLIKASAAKAE